MEPTDTTKKNLPACHTTSLDSSGQACAAGARSEDGAEASPCYLLELANGLAWTLSAENDLQDWLARFARIMQLSSTPGNGHAHFHIVRHRASGAMEAAEERPETEPGNAFCFENKYTRFRIDSQSGDVSCALKSRSTQRYIDVAHMMMALSPLYVSALQTGGLPLHAAVVERGGQAVLLAAPGSTGKSTCCRRIPAPWQSLCDDACLVVPTDTGGHRVHPLPTWSRFFPPYSNPLFKRQTTDRWNVQSSFDLTAVCFLEQSDDDWLEPLPPVRTALRLLGSFKEIHGNHMRWYKGGPLRDLWMHAMDNAGMLARSVPAAAMGVSLQGRFWEKLDDLLDETGKGRV